MAIDWFRTVDGYCERLDASFWSEPVNAVTNAAFLLAALVMWQRTKGQGASGALCLVLTAIGLGSFAFHTTAQVWAGLADVVPIVVFVLLYIYLATRHMLMQGHWVSLAAAVAFVPYAAATVPLFAMIPGLGGSSAYVPVPVLIAAYGGLMRKRDPKTARGLFIGAAILTLSITARAIDLPFCAQVPLGTHFLWHLLNALMLGWMIEVYHRHRLAGAPAEI